MPAVSDQLLFITWGRGEGGRRIFEGITWFSGEPEGDQSLLTYRSVLGSTTFFLFNVILFYNSLCD